MFFCGKMGSGKSTLAKQKLDENYAVLISEDDLLSNLYANKINSVKDYKHYSDKLKPVVFDLSHQILIRCVNVVLDFPANTKNQRQWLREISDSLNLRHVCYFVDRSDEICIKQLLQRGNPNTDTIEMFHAISQYFTKPGDHENINFVKV